MKKIGVAFTVGGLLVFIGGTFIMFSLCVESFLLVMPISLITGAVGAFGGIFLVMGIETKKEEALYANHKNARFSGDTLVLYDFNSKNGDPIKIKSFYDYNLNYHPSDIRYVGVTVGGVTTGGTYDAGNYYTNDATNTGKCHLVYEDSANPDGAIIEKIELHGKTLDSARRNSFIKQFLEGNTLVLKHKEGPKNESSIKASLDQNDPDLAYRLIKMDAISAMLSKDECKKIKHWICYGN